MEGAWTSSEANRVARGLGYTIFVERLRSPVAGSEFASFAAPLDGVRPARRLSLASSPEEAERTGLELLRAVAEEGAPWPETADP